MDSAGVVVAVAAAANAMVEAVVVVASFVVVGHSLEWRMSCRFRFVLSSFAV